MNCSFESLNPKVSSFIYSFSPALLEAWKKLRINVLIICCIMMLLEKYSWKEGSEDSLREKTIMISSSLPLYDSF